MRISLHPDITPQIPYAIDLPDIWLTLFIMFVLFSIGIKLLSVLEGENINTY